MVIREKRCPYCKQYFFFDNGVDENNEGEAIFREGFCPRCIDPHKLNGLTYDKEEILQTFKQYLRDNSVEVDALDIISILEMMNEFPRLSALYHSNGSYLTVNLSPGDKFFTTFGEFELGDYVPSNGNLYGHYYVKRHIKCLRCGNISKNSRQETLEIYLGIQDKRCIKCDQWERNTKGLVAGGRESEFSDRALAKALNVSRMDYRRNKGKYTKPVPVLPINTRVGCNVIKAAYWDENPTKYSPMYLIECVHCGQQSRILQKHVYQAVHYCSKLGRISS